MKKIFISVAMLCMALGGRAETQEVCQGWPADYGGVMLQAFWWDSYDATKWTNLTARAGELSQYFDLIWIPNAGTTSTGKWAYEHGYPIPNSMGYDPCYWLEYNSCFGREDELKTMISTYEALHVGIIEDVVVNHKNGVSEWRDFPNEVNVVGPKTQNVYNITWDNTNFSEICISDECNSHGYATTGERDTGDNFDGYRDLDHTKTSTQNNIKAYVRYLLDEMDFAGFRYDMVKGFGANYIGIYNNEAKPEFSVGEYWDGSPEAIQNWIDGTGKTSAAFDFPLKFKLNAAISSNQYSELQWKSFTYNPDYSRYSVTFADNHDTGRNNDKLQYNWSAANAFLLASPGTPCIWLPHYNADPTNIGAMIKARKMCGITNTYCTILQDRITDYNRGYILETEGHNGKVYCQFGAATSQGAPQGYTLVAEGDAYKFYAIYEKPSVTINPYGGTFYTDGVEVTITPNASALAVSPDPWYKIDDADAVELTEAVTINVGSGLNNGETVTIAWGAAGVDGGSVTFTKKERTDEIIYLNNAAGWSNIHCYAWTRSDEKTFGAWPGAEVQYDNSVGYYYITVPANAARPDFVIWNSGEKADQTKDLEYEAGKVYTNVDVPEVIYFKNTENWENVYCYAFTDVGAEILGAWPGKPVASNADGDYYVAFTAAVPDMVVWNNGLREGEGQQKTDDLEYENGRIYDASGSTYITLYFNNAWNWSNVYCYAWSGSGDNTTEYMGGWPGTKITQKDYETATGGFYKAVVPSQAVYVIFNIGSDQAKTADLTAADGHIYWPDSNGSGSDEYVRTGNSLFYPTSNKVGGFNVVLNNNGVYTCDILELTDREPFRNTVDFTAYSVSYERSSGAYKWGTIFMPFSLSSNEGVQYYTLKSVTSDKMTFTPVNQVSANTPAVYKLLGDAPYAIAADQTEVKATGDGTATVQPISDWTMHGTYSPVSGLVSVNNTVYFIAQDQFWWAEDPITVAPFRAWFETANPPSGAKLRIAIEGEAEGIESIEVDKNHGEIIFDLMGRQSDSSRKGIVIKNGKVVFVK